MSASLGCWCPVSSAMPRPLLSPFTPCTASRLGSCCPRLPSIQRRALAAAFPKCCALFLAVIRGVSVAGASICPSQYSAVSGPQVPLIELSYRAVSRPLVSLFVPCTAPCHRCCCRCSPPVERCVRCPFFGPSAAPCPGCRCSWRLGCRCP